MIGERFTPEFTEVCPRLAYKRPTVRLGQRESLDTGLVKDEMLKNSWVSIDAHGNTTWIGDLDDASLDAIKPKTRHVAIPPISGWGRGGDMMFMDLGDERPPGLIDIPEPVLRASMHQQGHLIREMMQDGQPVYWGSNFSAGTIEGDGLQSVLTPHTHVYKYGPELAGLTPRQISATRDGMLWDEGVSQQLGLIVGDRMREEVLPTYWNAQTKADRMGLTINLPGFTPEDFMSERFVRQFLRPLSLINHHTLKEHVHAPLFGSNMDDVINYVRSLKDQTHFDATRATYDGFFRTTPVAPDEGELLTTLRRFSDSGELRKPPGWTMGMQFTENGTAVFVTYGVLKRAVGPVEATGVNLVRPKEQLTQAEIAEMDNNLLKYYWPALQKASQSGAFILN